MTKRSLTRLALLGFVAAVVAVAGAGTASARGFHHHTGGLTKLGGYGPVCSFQKHRCGQSSGPVKSSPGTSPGTTAQPQIQSLDSIAAGSRVRF